MNSDRSSRRSRHRSARRTALLATLVLLPVVATVAPRTAPAGASSLPSGFAESTVAGGLNNPTAMALLPDGGILVTEQGGKLRLIRNGTLLATPVVTVTVNRTSEAGLDGVVIDPAFTANGYVYLYYTATTPNPHNRVSRFTMVGDTASPASELVLVDIDDLTGYQHNGGAMHFGPDGKLYVAVGDNYTATNAPSLTTLKGKILRIGADGSIPTDNPFVASTTGKYRSIWAIGLRNPYTFDFQPGTGRMFINDVGEQSWEEINQGQAGADFGWPATEGYTSDPAFVSPLYAYPHRFDLTGGCAITGGAFYDPASAQFPATYVGRYFFVDFCMGWMKTFDPASGAVELFATGLPSEPLMPTVGPDGSLYYVNRIGSDGLGVIRKITYTGSLAPSIGTPPASQLISVGHPATFSVGASGDEPLAYQWARDGVPIAGATDETYTTPALALGDDGASFTVTVTNAHGVVTSDPAVVTMTTAQPPTVTITAPTVSDLWQGGQTIAYAGTATDPQDGTLPPSASSWKVDLGHRAHFHPFLAPTPGTSGSFTIPTIGETDDQVFFRITLTATDSAGLTSSTSVEIQPLKTTLTVASTPPGLVVVVDGVPRVTPYSAPAVVGMVRELGTSTPQPVAGTNWAFASWSDGGAVTHDVTVPATNATFTATFTGLPTGTIAAAPNPMQVCSGSTGITTITWNSSATSVVEVHLGSPSGPTFAVSGPGSQSSTTGSWAEAGMVFYLQNRSGGLPLTAANTLATVTLSSTIAGCAPAGTLGAAPAPVPVCDGSGVGITTLSWTSTGTARVEVHVASPSGALFASTGIGNFSATTGKWVEEGMTFYLQNTTGGLPLTPANTLATYVAHTTRTGCPAGGIALNPNPIKVCSGSTTGSALVTWDSTVKRVEVRVNAPNGQLFGGSGPGPRSLATGNWVGEGTTFFLQDVSNGKPLTAANTLASIVAHVSVAGCSPSGAIGATPNPIMVCDGTGFGITTVNWTSAGTTAVEVRLNSPNGQLFASSGSGARSATTGKWVYNGMVFYLQNRTGGLPLTAANTIATVTVPVTSIGCGS